MLQNIIKQAEIKAGSQKALAEKMGIVYHRFGDYKAGRRMPNDVTIGQLAEYVGLNPIETILLCKLETDKEKATLWQAWLKDWRAYPDSNWGPSASEIFWKSFNKIIQSIKRFTASTLVA